MRDIARYTLETWGTQRMGRYLDDLENSLASLKDSPDTRGQDRGKGLRSLSHRDHYFIFYRIIDKTVVILRVLHQRTNWQKHLQ